MKSLIEKHLPPNSFLRNVVVLTTGSTFAQVLAILVAPILTRLYSPENFGVFALYISILGVLAVIACWRYELAIVLPERDRDAANLLVLSILISVGMSLLTFILVGMFRYQLARLVGAPELTPWLWLLPLSLLATGLFQAFSYWSTRRKQFKRLAARQITQSTVTVIAQLGAGVTLHPGPGGLIGGSILGQLTATGRLTWQIWRDEGAGIRAVASMRAVDDQLRRFRQFPLFSTWASLFNTIANLLPALMLGYFFNSAVVGFYALGHRLLALPLSLIGGSIAQVFFPEATQINRSGNIQKFSLGMYVRLLDIGLIPILLLMVVAPELFVIIFGSRWAVAGEYSRWLGLWLVFQLASSPISTLYYVLDKQNLYLAFSLSLFFFRVFAITIGGIYDRPLLAIILLGITGALVYFFNAIVILFIAGNRMSVILRRTLKSVCNSIPFLLPPVGAKIFWPTSHLAIVAAIGSGLFFICLRLRQGVMRKETSTG